MNAQLLAWLRAEERRHEWEGNKPDLSEGMSQWHAGMSEAYGNAADRLAAPSKEAGPSVRVMPDGASMHDYIGRLGCGELGIVDQMALANMLDDASPDIDAAVNRFLCWKLPANFSPDAGISFTPYDPPQYPHMREHCWPVGTNLLTATQAKAMLQYVLATAPQDSGGTLIHDHTTARTPTATPDTSGQLTANPSGDQRQEGVVALATYLLDSAMQVRKGSGGIYVRLTVAEAEQAAAFIQSIATTERLHEVEPDGYTSYGEFRWACDCDERMRAEWTPVWTGKAPQPASPPPEAAAAVGESLAKLESDIRIYADSDLDASRLGRLAQFWADRLAALASPTGVDEAMVEAARLIVDGAMPATASGHTCFVPRYQVEKLKAALAARDGGAA